MNPSIHHALNHRREVKGEMARILTQYRGELSTADLTEGMNAAQRNASRLLEDAEVLIEAKRYPTACSLAILAIEEAGKVAILRGMSTRRDAMGLKKGWGRYRHHRAKNVAWILGDLVRGGARRLQDLNPMFDEDSEHPKVLDTVKQLGFYTDCFRQGHWSEPPAVIDEELARSILLIARTLARSKREISQREMELWVELVGPYIDSDRALDALMEWHRAMLAEGLTDIPEETAANFAFGTARDQDDRT